MNGIRKDGLKEIQLLRQEFTQDIEILESYRQYIEAMTSRGTASDVVLEINRLREPFSELMNVDKSTNSIDALGLTEVRFSSEDSQRGIGSVFGKIVVNNTSKGNLFILIF